MLVRMLSASFAFGDLPRVAPLSLSAATSTVSIRRGAAIALRVGFGSPQPLAPPRFPPLPTPYSSIVYVTCHVSIVLAPRIRLASWPHSYITLLLVFTPHSSYSQSLDNNGCLSEWPWTTGELVR